jgi:acetyl esterase/lipase
MLMPKQQNTGQPPHSGPSTNRPTSSGGCIAATTTLRAIEEDYPIDAQILICPVLNNTATVEGQWAESQFSPWLTPSRMTWYRDLYFPSASEPWEWHASPVYAPAKLMALCPPTFLAIAECDLLAPEAKEYADSLTSQGVSVDKRVYTGGTHSLLVLAGYVSPRDLLYARTDTMLLAFTS